jgi:threonine synthase
VGSSIATAQSTYQALLAIRGSAGAVYQVTDEDILRAQHMLVETEGLFVEAASAAGIAALIMDADQGALDRDGNYVFVNTSAGIKSIAAMGNMDIEPEMVTDEQSFDEFMSLVLTGEGEGQAT